MKIIKKRDDYLMEFYKRYPVQRGKFSLEDIKKVTAAVYDVTCEELVGQSRAGYLRDPRTIAAYLSAMLTYESLVSIGETFGGRDHTTMISSCKGARNLIDTEKAVEEKVDEIIRRIADTTVPIQA